jgi:hypothetical protein
MTTDCQHHWVIDAPNGRTSSGVCKHCGEHKTFRNGEAEDRNVPITSPRYRAKAAVASARVRVNGGTI